MAEAEQSRAKGIASLTQQLEEELEELWIKQEEQLIEKVESVSKNIVSNEIPWH